MSECWRAGGQAGAGPGHPVVGADHRGRDRGDPRDRDGHPGHGDSGVSAAGAA